MSSRNSLIESFGRLIVSKKLSSNIIYINISKYMKLTRYLKLEVSKIFSKNMSYFTSGSSNL